MNEPSDPGWGRLRDAALVTFLPSVGLKRAMTGNLLVGLRTVVVAHACTLVLIAGVAVVLDLAGGNFGADVNVGVACLGVFAAGAIVVPGSWMI